MYLIERMMFVFLICKSTQTFHGIFKVDGNILYGFSDDQKEKTLPKVSPFIVWSLMLIRAKSWLQLGLGPVLP